MSVAPAIFSGVVFPGHAFDNFVEEDSAALGVDSDTLLSGFTLQAQPTISPTPGTDDALQLQEWVILPHESNPALRRSFWSGWKEVDGTPSGVWTATGPKATPWELSNITQIVTSAAASTATSGGITYVRLGGVDFYQGTYTLLLSTDFDCYEATYDGETVEYAATPFLTEAGQGRVDDGPVTLASPFRRGANLWCVYAVNSATPETRYWVARKDGDSWTKIGETYILAPEVDEEMNPTGSDGGGIEYHYLTQLGPNANGRIVLTYEGFSGTNWSGHAAHAQINSGDVEAALIGGMTKYGSVIAHDAATTWAQVHVATPTIHVTPDGVVHCFNQGSNVVGTGGGTTWKLGRGTNN